ncbi:MAG: hypothetical protein EOM64_02660 [Erysipelotrichia bacterium]|nr:hypothetical protein [Erysipelotrichia bacterium]
MPRKFIKISKSLNRYAIVYLLLSAASLIFLMFIESSYHAEVSVYIRYLFAIPLFAGFMPCFITEHMKIPSPGSFWYDAVLILTAGSLLRGILDLYIPPSATIKISVYISTVFTVLGIALIKYRSSSTSISK